MKKIALPLILMAAACQATAPVKTADRIQAKSAHLLSHVHFDTGSSEILNPEKIRHNARWLKRHPRKVIVLEGHCDERGSRAMNLSLGDRRARSVMKALMDRGVPEKQLIIMSFGESEPVDPRHHKEAWAANRRVAFTIR